MLFDINRKDFIKKEYVNKISHFFDSKEYTIDNLNNDYHLRPTWGLFNKKNLNQWYDKNAVNLSPIGLKLLITNHLFETEEYGMINHGIGMVISKNYYTYGLFEWNIVLPVGKNLWPAIWLTHAETWPPEIDVLEAYSDDKMKYGNKYNTNVYYLNLNGTDEQVGAMPHGYAIKPNEMLNLKLDWTMNYIRIYYNNCLVRQITDKNILKWFNDNPLMKVIMNNAIAKTTTLNEMNVSPFIIKNFYYSN